jgi:Ca2+-transporting ATPase
MAALASGLIGERQDTIAILVIVLHNPIIAAVQEFRTEHMAVALRVISIPVNEDKRSRLYRWMIMNLTVA